jgi:hypothetical protein
MGGLVRVEAGEDTMQVQLRCWPNDPPFRSTVEAVLAGLPERCPDALEQGLRERYPAARVHAQTGVGAVGGLPYRWYIYRDGSLLPR